MINGTKLLNVAGMTRGRRDGILKSEKTRHVVKIGPMHLKGVWYVVYYTRTTTQHADLLQDPIRTSSGFCKQGENNRATISTLCPRYWCSSIPPFESDTCKCGSGCSCHGCSRSQPSNRPYTATLSRRPHEFPAAFPAPSPFHEQPNRGTYVPAASCDPTTPLDRTTWAR